MEANINILIVGLDKKDSEKLYKICSTLKNVNVRKDLKSQFTKEYFQETKPNIVIVGYCERCKENNKIFNTIKNYNPHTLIIAVVDRLNSDTEKEIVQLGATTYVHSSLKKEDKVQNKISKYVELLKDGAYNYAPVKQVELNVFAEEVRSIETKAIVRNDVDMMDFGLWVTDRYLVKHENQSSEFGKTMEFLYFMIKRSLVKNEFVVLQATESYTSIFVSFDVASTGFYFEVIKEYQDIKDRVVCYDDQIHFKFNIYPSNLEVKPDVSFVPVDKKAFKPIREIEEEEKEHLRKDISESISAPEFILSLTAEDLYMVADLREYEDTLYDYLGDLEYEFNNTVFKGIGESVVSFANSLSFLYSFPTLSYSLLKLGTTIKEQDIKILSNKQKEGFKVSISGIYSDLRSWRKNIFEDQIANNINYLDSSLLSSCIQIETLLKKESYNNDSLDELELF